MNTKDLILYEMPSIAEYVGIEWMQHVIARYTALKVSRKVRRYDKRKRREEFIKSLNS